MPQSQIMYKPEPADTPTLEAVHTIRECHYKAAKRESGMVGLMYNDDALTGDVNGWNECEAAPAGEPETLNERWGTRFPTDHIA
jgi:uncharacterized protein CbrC (UPF0167 family)